jgi:hypothetical protein
MSLPNKHTTTISPTESSEPAAKGKSSLQEAKAANSNKGEKSEEYISVV